MLDVGNLVNPKTGNNFIPVAIQRIENSNGTALKFADGTLICMANKKFKITTESEMIGNNTLYRSNSLDFNDYPIEFIELPSTSFSVVTHDSPVFLWLGNMSLFRGSKKHPNRVICYSNENTAVTVTISYIAIGRWK